MTQNINWKTIEEEILSYEENPTNVKPESFIYQATIYAHEKNLCFDTYIKATSRICAMNSSNIKEYETPQKMSEVLDKIFRYILTITERQTIKV